MNEYLFVLSLDSSSSHSSACSLLNAQRKSNPQPLSKQAKFSKNDIAVLTRTEPLNNYWMTPLDENADKVECVVTNAGPYYVDVLVKAGLMKGTFGEGEERQKNIYRLDRFFSDVTHARMCDAVASLTSLDRRYEGDNSGKPDPHEEIRDVILQSFAALDVEASESLRASSTEKLRALSKRISKAPNKYNQADIAAAYREAIDSRKGCPDGFNNSQITAIAASLTRSLTNIIGPPGTGKTTTAAAIARGAVHLQRSRDPSLHSKVLCCAFSNVGADNFAEKLINAGLRVIRVGRSSTVNGSLLKHTLDYWVDQDEVAQESLRYAAEMTSRLRTTDRNKDGAARRAATDAVKKSIAACQRASYFALKNCDVVVSTCVGAVDPRLMACLGRDTDDRQDGSFVPPINLELDFVIVDEACQSVEPATLVPFVASGCE